MPRGRGRRETNARLQHNHITMHSWHNQICISDRSPKHKHLYTKPASHESSFNSANRKIEILLPLSSPHRRLQLMIRAPEVFASTVRVLNCFLFVIDTRAGVCRHKPDDSLKYMPAPGAMSTCVAGTFAKIYAGAHLQLAHVPAHFVNVPDGSLKCADT